MVSQCLGITTGWESVLWWVAQGMANPEIGNILGPSAVSVPKHTEHIFAKLTGETRTAAALRPFELVRRSPELA